MAKNERERIEKTIFYLRRAEGLFLGVNDTESFEQIRELIADLERQKQNPKPEGENHGPESDQGKS
jgi:hypothetical protein